MNRNICLIALDIDGTLTDSKKRLPEANREALIKVQKSGVRIILVSGRPLYGIRPIAEKLEMDKYEGYIMAFNGGVTIECQTDKQVSEFMLPKGITMELSLDAKDNDAVILTYEGDYIVTEKPDDEYVQKEAFLNRMEVKKIDDFGEYVKCNVPKCLIVGEPMKLAKTENKLKEKYEGILNVFRSEPYFLEIVPQGIDKAVALERFLRTIGQKRDNLMAMGDGFNDLPMIKYAGFSVAMSNAQEPVRAAADYVTLSNDESGVAAAVEKFLLTKK